ncbi:MAG: hypothetical protein QXK94_03030 [Candidatus Jordarchaeales archaeon]
MRPLPRRVRKFESERRRLKKNVRVVALRGERWMAYASLPWMRELCGHLYGENCCVKLEEKGEGVVQATVYASTAELADAVASELERGFEIFRTVEGWEKRKGQA